jgi:A/G-specific adenine glycosylase
MLGWFSTNARDLPWRRTRDPYAVWISETMLQQTQVETVRGYFTRFLERFPPIAELAAADEREVLRLWEGLGYYRRARQLHAAARKMAEEHGGEFPRTPEAVRALPGVGRYTAGAVLSIAMDQREPILEANTIRVYSRLLGYRGDPLKASGQKRLWEFAEAILPPAGPECGQLNQAMMELGSAFCRPQQPGCLLCPVAALCPTRGHGLQEQIPPVKARMRYESVQEVAVLIRRRGQLLVRRCAADERWAGLWDFPRFQVESLPASTAAIQQRIAEWLGIRIVVERSCHQIKYGVTRFRITLDAHAARYQSGRLAADPGLQWIDAQDLGELPLSVTGRKLAQWAMKEDA